MPIIDKDDATDVEEHIERIFAAESADARVLAIRRLFAEKLDFDQQSGTVSLSGAPRRGARPTPPHRRSAGGQHLPPAELVTARERQEGDIMTLERQIDAIIYQTYGITEQEQEAIADWLAQSG